MAAHWWWSWSLGLPSTDYSGSGFTVSNTANVLTNNTTSLFTPATGSTSPSEEFHTRITGTATITTPAFQNGSITQGWLVYRWANPGNNTLNTLGRFTELMNGAATVRIDLRVNAISNTPLLELRVNGTLIGTSTLHTNIAKYLVIAIDFDVSVSPPQAGLVLNGKREIARAGGSGSATNIDRVRFSSGASSSNFAYIGDIAVFSSLADLTDQTSQDVWVTFLDPDSATDGDNSWTPSSGTDLTAVNDATSSTYTETSTSPDSITYGFESCNTRQSGWSPQAIYGLATVAFATAATSQTDTTLDLQDTVPASTGSTNVTLTSTPTFLGVWSPDDSTASAWTQTTVDGSTAIYSVA